jgi:DNA mismatch endonuclease (patch repair protein)
MGFWKPKFAETVKRDRRNLEALRKLGWRVAVVWECSVKEIGAEAVATNLSKWLQSKSSFKEISSTIARQKARRR